MIVSTFSGNMLSGKTFEIFFPALFMMLLAPRNIEPKPIANEKKITTKPINSDENQACCGAKGPISLLANVSIVKLGESKMPVSAKVKVKIKELVHFPLYIISFSKTSEVCIVPGDDKYAE